MFWNIFAVYIQNTQTLFEELKENAEWYCSTAATQSELLKDKLKDFNHWLSIIVYLKHLLSNYFAIFLILS